MTSPTRPRQLADFYEALEACVSANRPNTAASQNAADKIFSRLRESTGEIQDVSPSRFPVLRHIDQCLQQPGLSQPVSRLADAMKAIDPLLHWKRRDGAEEVSQAFVDGHANTLLAGPDGYEKRSDVLVGASLLAPHMTYPKHDHPPEEFYVVIAKGDWYNEDDGWYDTQIGDVIFHRSGLQHTMRAGDTPVLAVWCLWVK